MLRVAMRKLTLFILYAVCMFLAISFTRPERALAAPDDHAIPAPLKPWIPWVLADAPTALCAFVNGTSEERACSWPSSLALELGDKGGSFRQTWQLDSEEEVPLPGGAKHWPLDVRVDGKAASVIERNGMPKLRLAVGTHKVQGTFRWDTLPDAVAAPELTGIVELTVRGKRVPFPNFGTGGEVFTASRQFRKTEHPTPDSTAG